MSVKKIKQITEHIMYAILDLATAILIKACHDFFDPAHV